MYSVKQVLPSKGTAAKALKAGEEAVKTDFTVLALHSKNTEHTEQ